MRIIYRPDFNPMLINWGGPDQRVSDCCSVCDEKLPEDTVPFRCWRADGWAGVFCNGCFEKVFVVVEDR